MILEKGRGETARKREGNGEWIVGRGDYRNYYKGHMDKTKGEGGGGGGRWVWLGWGGVEQWEENADNCN